MDLIRDFARSIIWGIGLNIGDDVYKKVKKEIKKDNHKNCHFCNSNLIYSCDYVLCTNERCISNN